MDLTGRIPPLRHVRYFLEYLVLRTLFALFGLLSLDNASAVGGYLGARIGPKLPISRRAVSNLQAAFPDWENVEVSETVRSMWVHLGRMAGEYPHLRIFKFCDDDDRIEIIGSEYIDQLRDDGISGIFFSAHLGNWELLPVAASKRGLPLVHVYRAANNPYVENLIEWRHKQGYVVNVVSTGETGTSTTNIKNYILNAYNNWENPPEHVCFIGDANGSIYVSTYTVYGGSGWSQAQGEGDFPYSLLEGDDLLPEISLGRISIRSTTELITAINKLRGSIGSINRESRNRLLHAFDIVNSHFKEKFTHLFGGVEAYLKLEGSDDPLEAGLELMASPPGKKLQQLDLLSGGEKAITALALIFSAYLVKDIASSVEFEPVPAITGILPLDSLTHNSITLSCSL